MTCTFTCLAHSQFPQFHDERSNPRTSRSKSRSVPFVFDFYWQFPKFKLFTMMTFIKSPNPRTAESAALFLPLYNWLHNVERSFAWNKLKMKHASGHEDLRQGCFAATPRAPEVCHRWYCRQWPMGPDLWYTAVSARSWWLTALHEERLTPLALSTSFDHSYHFWNCTVNGSSRSCSITTLHDDDWLRPCVICAVESCAPLRCCFGSINSSLWKLSTCLFGPCNATRFPGLILRWSNLALATWFPENETGALASPIASKAHAQAQWIFNSIPTQKQGPPNSQAFGRHGSWES